MTNRQGFLGKLIGLLGGGLAAPVMPLLPRKPIWGPSPLTPLMGLDLGTGVDKTVSCLVGLQNGFMTVNEVRAAIGVQPYVINTEEVLKESLRPCKGGWVIADNKDDMTVTLPEEYWMHITNGATDGNYKEVRFTNIDDPQPRCC